MLEQDKTLNQKTSVKDAVKRQRDETSQENKKTIDFLMRFKSSTFNKMQAHKLITNETMTSLVEDAMNNYLDSKANKEIVEKGLELLELINKSKGE